MAKTLDELMKSITKREAKRDAQMSFVMSKIKSVPNQIAQRGIQKKKSIEKKLKAQKMVRLQKIYNFLQMGLSPLANLRSSSRAPLRMKWEAEVSLPLPMPSHTLKESTS